MTGNPFGMTGRSSGGALRRFANPPRDEPIIRSNASLRHDHPAITEGRTIFPSRVFEPVERGRVLIDGFNNSKIGRYITKGPWKGFRIYTLSLEERATCPSSCGLWDACYGNALPMAVRFRYGAPLIKALDRDLLDLSRQHAGGFAVRLHVLGDFPELSYVGEWANWLHQIKHLHVWGYTAHPADSEIGSAVAKMNTMFPGRWSFRHSVAPHAPLAPDQATTVWEKPAGMRAAGGLVCPAEPGRTETCGTCGLCWSPAMKDTRIVFLGHGMTNGRQKATDPVFVRAKVRQQALSTRPTPDINPSPVQVPLTPAAPSLPTVAEASFREALVLERARLMVMVERIDQLLVLYPHPKGAARLIASGRAPLTRPAKLTTDQRAPKVHPTDGRLKENMSAERRAALLANLALARQATKAKRTKQGPAKTEPRARIIDLGRSA